MAALFGTREQREARGTERGLFRMFYHIKSECNYSDRQISNQNMYLFLNKITSSGKSGHAFTYGRFLDTCQGSSQDTFQERPRWWPAISSGFYNIRCTVTTYIIPENISQDLLNVWNNCPAQITRSVAVNFNAYFRRHANPSQSGWIANQAPRLMVSDSDSYSDSSDSDSSDSGTDTPTAQVKEKLVTEEEMALKLSITEECAICYESFNVDNINWWSSCEHLCCTNCQLGMKQSGRTIKCPLCRVPVTDEAGVPIKILQD